MDPDHPEPVLAKLAELDPRYDPAASSSAKDRSDTDSVVSGTTLSSMVSSTQTAAHVIPYRRFDNFVIMGKSSQQTSAKVC